MPHTENSYNVTRLGVNVFVVKGSIDGQAVEILVSYETPVAYRTWIGADETAERTATRFSRSTERHIQDWQYEREPVTIDYTDQDGNAQSYGTTHQACRHPYGGTIAQSELDRLMRDLTGGTRLRGRARAAQLGRTEDTERWRSYESHTEQGDANLMIPVSRRHR